METTLTRDSDLILPDFPPKQDSAARATLKALLNCYLRELAPYAQSSKDRSAPVLLEFDLGRSFTRLRVEVTYWSLTGPHDFGALHLFDPVSRDWRSAAIGEVLPILVVECFGLVPDASGSKMLELLRRILNSWDQMSQSGRQADRPELNFLSAEQSLHFGHWLHPTPKSREGMTDWHQGAYAPEYGAKFQLQFFAVNQEIARSGSACGKHLNTLIRRLPGLDFVEVAADEVLIPMHPLQAEALRLDAQVAELIRSGLLRELGPKGPHFAATSSVRTVYAADCPWMLKFSLPVKITNSRRVNLAHELEAGVVIARLLGKLDPLPPEFQIIADPAYVTLDLPGQRESGFEVILRDNPFMGEAGQGVVTIAALTADPLPGHQSMLARLVMNLSRASNQLPSKAARAWFSAYLDCALRPVLDLYDKVGIALEAHQQNSLLDVGNGLPSRYFFRDNQGYYIADSKLDDLAQLEPQLREIDALCFPEAEINQRFCYYLIVNQIFSVISRLGRDGFADEADLIGDLVTCLQDVATRLSGPGAGFVEFLLTTPRLSSKANLLTRVYDVDELQAQGEKAPYVHLPNPLAAQPEELRNDFA